MATRTVKKRFANRCMVETIGTHTVRKLDNGDDSFLERQEWCISTAAGLALCGRTAYRLLPHLKYKHCMQIDVCGECRKIANRKGPING